MKIDREQWSRLSALLDTALEIDPNERDAWLQQLPDDAATLKAPLRTLLAQRAHIETGDFLKTPDFASALRLETARSQTQHAELEAGSTVGAYRLLRELGRGGMAAVWLAERIDGKLKRQVALKFPYAGPNQRQLAERLVRERDILASLEHPNIARLYDADVTALGQPYLVLEYVDGVPIGEYCDQHHLTVRERLVLFLQVLNAVQYAHSHLVIHRDLKPSNILINRDRVGQLLDFGIAQLISEGGAKDSVLTNFEGRALTPDYASPEQLSGQPITTATDVYSLGVVLYELLTGTRPYRAKRDSRAALEDAIIEAEVIWPSRVVREGVAASALNAKAFKGDVDAILLKALQKDGARRYASVDAFRSDIECYLDGRGVLAQPDSAWYRLKKFGKRHRVPVAASMLIFVALAAGLVVAVWQGRVASREAEKSAAINRFLMNVFSGADIGVGTLKPPNEMTVAELLDHSSAQMLDSFDQQPEVKLELIRLIAGIYSMMEVEEKGIALYRQGIDYSERKLGANNQAKAWLLLGIANDQAFAGHFDKAEPSVIAAEAAFKASGDDRSADYASLLKLKGNLLRRKGPESAAESKAILQRSVALFEKYYPQDSDLSAAYMFLAQVHISLAEDDDAERAAERAVVTALQSTVSRSEQANALSLRASIRQRLGKFVAAEGDYAAASSLYRETVGPHHFLYLQNENLRGESLQAQGRRADGLMLLESTTAEIAVIRPNSTTVANALRRLASAQLRDGSLEQAAQTSTQAVAVARSQHQPLLLATTLLDQAEVLTSLEQFDSAASCLAEAANLTPNNGSPDSTIARIYYLQGSIAVKQGRLDAASELARLALAATKGTGLAERRRRARLHILDSQIALARSDTRLALDQTQLAQQMLATTGLDTDLFTRATVLTQRGVALCRGARQSEGRAILTEAEKIVERTQNPVGRPLVSLKAEIANCHG